MITSFWSTHHGQTATTSAAVAVASAAALLQPERTLLAHTHTSRSTLETCLFTQRDMQSFDIGEFSNHGLDALLRLSRNGRLQGEMVPDYSWSVLKENRLDVLPGSEKSTPSEGDDTVAILRVFDAAKEFYGRVFVDVHSGVEPDVTLPLLKTSGQTVICLNQNTHVLASYFQDKPLRSQIEKPNTVFLLSRYDADMGMTAADVARKHNISRNRVLVLPYSAAFAHAANEGRVYDFISRHLWDAKSPELPFMQALKTLALNLEDVKSL